MKFNQSSFLNQISFLNIANLIYIYIYHINSYEVLHILYLGLIFPNPILQNEIVVVVL